MSNLYELTAVELRRLFQSRQASPVEYAQETFAHAEVAERTINAFAETMFDRALDQAAEAERRYAGKGRPPRPLEGLLVAVKEELDLAGHRKTNGVLGEDPEPVRSTDPAVERVLEAGGIVHARTTTSEFCTLPVSHTTRWGVTRNPWSPAWSTGGSSGGSAASVAAGTSALALGTDGGGSVRAPASLCGVVGYKAPYGRVPQPPPGNFDTWVHTGPLARSVEDCVLLQNVIAGPHPVDNAALSPKLVLPTPDGWIGDLRVGVCPVPGDHLVDQEVIEATLRVAQGLVAAGAHVEETALDWRRHEVYQAMWGHFGSGWAQEIQSAVQQRDASISPYTREFVERALRTAGTITADEGSNASAELFGKLSASMDGLDVILVPTMGGIGYRAGEDYVEEPLVVAGSQLDHFVEASLTPALNACSRCPAVSVPIGVASNGVPMGVQVIARPLEDLTVMRVAAAIEATQPWVQLAPLPVSTAW